MGSKRSVTLDNGTILGILRNAAVLKRFPALRNVAKRLPKAGCGRCGSRKSAKQRNVVLQGLKQTIFSWPEAQKKGLKKVLGADELIVVINKRVIKF